MHVLARGRIQTTGGPELAAALEQTGYAEWADDEAEAAVLAGAADPFADPLRLTASLSLRVWTSSAPSRCGTTSTTR